eukprot:TRINITY_DN1259_c0_g1::TRINITY_DN1259_c0_g1_i1::g.26863::m.26863 TRINITY_DN1259_c0_g1::TRINITY_DN1259_c0_g1_i1::g.26863  ORF type:complete len:348 (-),score=69.62 TRINITY_DN1259_c0_g1_i1:14-997(-)
MVNCEGKVLSLWPSDAEVLSDPEASFVCFPDPLKYLHEWLLLPRPLSREEVDNYTNLPSFLHGYKDFFDSLPVDTPQEFVDATACLVKAIAILTAALVAVHFIWNIVWSGFRNVNPAHKKWYVVANVSKAFFLGAMSVSRLWWWYGHKGLWQDQWHFHPLQGCYTKRTGVLYVVTDIVALYMVPKLPKSTIIHHWATLFLCMWTWASTDHSSVVFRMINVYGAFSALAFLVNFYLAMRVIYPDRRPFMEFIRICAFWTYFFACAGNWTWHACWAINLLLGGNLSITAIIYLCSLAFVGQDDIVLMKWLWNPKPPPKKADDSDDKKDD